MKRTRKETLFTESVIAWSPDEARSFFAYLDRLAEDSVTQDESEEAAPSGSAFGMLRPALAA